MTFIAQTQRSSVTMLAAFTVATAVSMPALVAGPLNITAAPELLASTVSQMVSDIHDILVSSHADARADRADVVAARESVRTNRRQSAAAIGASILEGSVGEGQIGSIVDTTRAANKDERQAITMSRGEVRDTRQGARSDIRAAVADTYDGSTVQAVRAIIDTAEMDNAQTRSTILSAAQGNSKIRRNTAKADAAIRQSARAGEITRDQAAEQITSARSSAKTQVAANRAQMVSSVKDISATRQQAAHDVHNTVHQHRTGE